jgi:hypothetical protein
MDSLGPALSFFSEEALRYYLPAFLIASAREQTTAVNADPLFHLTHGLDDSSARERINTRRYGQRVWEDCARFRFSIFNKQQALGIVSYLEHELLSQNRSDSEKRSIREALARYWAGRTREEG